MVTVTSLPPKFDETLTENSLYLVFPIFAASGLKF
jgi:hypothetical protein